MILRPAKVVMARNLTAPFEADSGTGPYTYSVLPGGAGGTIDPTTGVYTSPTVGGSDTIQAVDSLLAEATSVAVVMSPLQLFCDVIQHGLGLADGRVYLWDQKINSPTDNGLWVAISQLTVKNFGSKSELNTNGDEEQSVNIHSTLQVDILSRDASARDRKEEVIMALGSFYSRQQQALNSFKIFPLSHSFVNLSEIDGAAIPYRYSILCNVQYFVTKVQGAEYFEDFSVDTPEIES